MRLGVLVVFLSLLAVLAGQAQTGAIQGIVTDQSGAVVPSVTITLTNVETGVAVTATTNETGWYAFPFQPPGNYRIEAAKEGFAPMIRERFKLDVQQVARVDFRLSVGTVTQTMEVSDAAALLETENTQMGQVIENKRIIEMPLNKRNYLELARLAPGVLPASTLDVGARTGADGGIVAMGQRGNQMNVLLDGVDNSSRAGGGEVGRLAQAATPSVDAVGEFRVITNNFSAEFGYRTGPKVIVTLKSGGNQFHGSLFEFVRNDRLDASNFFANRSGSRKPSYRQNQFGWTLGGRILRDRTFFFGSFEGTRIRLGRSLLSTVPSPLARAGDFSLEATNRNRVFDPLTTSGSGAAARRLVFPNNAIPRARFDPVVQNILPLYPLPNVAGAEFRSNNYFRSPSDTDDRNQTDVKLDHNFSRNHRAFFRYSGRRQTSLNNSPLPREAGGSGGNIVELDGDNWAAGWFYTLSSRAFHELRFGFTHMPTVRGDLVTEPLNAKYGIKNAPGDRFEDGIRSSFSLFDVAGFASLGNSNTPLIHNLDSLHLLNNLAVQKGAHSLKLGFEHRRIDLIRNASRLRRGRFRFTGVYTAEQPNVAASRSSTGNPVADLLLGMANATTVGTPNGENAIVPYWGWYIQDDWKLSPRLTLNLGLRWELFQSTMFAGGWRSGYPGVSNFLTEYAGVGPGDPRYETFQKPRNDRDCGCRQDLNNFSPRIGLAYQLSARTVLRAAAGIFYGEGDQVYVDQSSFAPNTPDFTETTTNGTNLEPAALVANGFPFVELPAKAPVPGSRPLAHRSQRTNFYSSQWFLDVQRELPGGFIWVVGYQGTQSVKLTAERDINNPGPHPTIPASQRLLRPQWSGVNLRGDPVGAASYEALVTRLERRFSRGLTVLTSYTWSHNIDNSTQFNDSNTGMADPYNLRRERGNSNLDHRQAFTSSFTYELPLGRGRTFGSAWRAPLDAILGGWQVGGIVTFRSGFPFDVRYPGDPQNSGTVNRGDRIATGRLPNPSIDRWFDEFAFVQSAPGVFGNTGRNVLFGPGTRNLDFMAGKRFRLPWEGHSLQFRFESFNFSNTPKFGQPNANLRTPAAATISQADEPRRIQFGLKYVF